MMPLVFEDKEEIRKLIGQEIGSQLERAQRSALEAHKAATHTEMKAENKYDTKGLEASYLATAQSSRAEELAAAREKILAQGLKDFESEDLSVAVGALVKVGGVASWFFILPAGGGVEITYKDEMIKVVTPNAPLALSMDKLHRGNEIQRGHFADKEIENLI